MTKITLPVDDYLKVARSRTGRGVFAMKDFKKGETICEFAGRFRSGDLDEEIDDRTRDNMVRYDRHKYVSPEGEIGAFFNHSCEPNSKIMKRQKKLWVVALQDIKAGKQVTFDYSTVTARDDIWRMDCKCGSATCRHTVKPFHQLSKKLQKRYLDEKIVPSYILTIQ